MKYFVRRDSQEFGPYSLADLQRYLAQGNIVPTDMARGEESQEWAPVAQVAGNIAVPPPSAAPPDYGRVPGYGMSPAPTEFAEPAAPLPPGLHWALVLLFAILTCGVFSWVWMFIQAAFVKKIRPQSRAMIYYAIGIAGSLGAQIVVLSNPYDAALPRLLGLGFGIVLLVGAFSLRSDLEEYYNSVEPIGLQLSGVMTFFFNTIYFQYHLCRIRKWKETGVWS